MKLERHVFTLECSGRTFTANRNIIGIDQAGELTEGYDAELLPTDDEGTDFHFTPAERIEIAEYMIQRWTVYRDAQIENSADANRQS